MNYTEPTKEDIIKWCQALRSGKYKQTQYSLEDRKGFCCLGVACDVFIPDFRLITTGINYRKGFIKGDEPGEQPYAPVWLKDINELFCTLTDEHLSVLNDEHKFSFDEIADVLEAVFVLDVLDDQK